MIILTIAALAFGGFWFLRSKKNKSVKPTYSIVKTVRDSISETVETTGEVSALNRVEIKPSISGQVDKLLVGEGDSVKKGQILAYLSSTDRVAILDAVRANDAKNLKQWENTYKATPVVSPMDGKIILRNVVEGQTINTTDVLFALADKLIIVASVDEADIGKVKIGQKTSVNLDAYQNISVDGKIFQILEEGKNVNSVITYYVKIECANLPDFFKSLMTANVVITINETQNAVILPWNAVNEDKDGKSYVLVGNNEAQTKKYVQPGLQDGGQVEIVSGLNEGDEVLVKNDFYSTEQKQAKTFMEMGRARKTNSEIIGGEKGGRKKSRQK